MANNLFNQELYFLRIQTKRLGRRCLFFDKVESTIDIAAEEQQDTLVLAYEQTKGRGQRQNTWLSPPGCAMGSVRLDCLKVSTLGRRVCFLQHIMALSIARTLENLDEKKFGRDKIGLKWPNDIFYTKGGFQKIGGILAHTIESGDKYKIILSFGLNVFNEKPTTCVNRILSDSADGRVPGLSIESIVASAMNNLEEFTLYLTDEKFKKLKQEYESRCLQMNQIVQDELNGAVRVAGVNDDGYLIGFNSPMRQMCTVTKIV